MPLVIHRKYSNWLSWYLGMVLISRSVNIRTEQKGDRYVKF
jgi:hypothetical protein